MISAKTCALITLDSEGRPRVRVMDPFIPENDFTVWFGTNPKTRKVEQIKNNPDSRRIIVSAWNVGEVDKMALPPCHAFFQFYVADGKLSCQLYQRSADTFLGVPFNVASYAILTMMVAQVCNLELGEFVHTLGDAHIYSNHFDQVELQLSREPHPYPQLVIQRKPDSLFDYRYEDFVIENYEHHPHIKAPVAV